MSDRENARTYPTRPYLAVSAAIFRDGKVLIVRRARPPAHGLYTLPGGGVVWVNKVPLSAPTPFFSSVPSI